MAGPTCWVLEAPIEMRQRAPAWSRLGARRAPALFVPRQPCGLDVCVRRNVLLAADRPWLFGAGRRCSRAVNTNRWNSSSRPDAQLSRPYGQRIATAGVVSGPPDDGGERYCVHFIGFNDEHYSVEGTSHAEAAAVVKRSTKKGWSLRSGWRDRWPPG